MTPVAAAITLTDYTVSAAGSRAATTAARRNPVAWDRFYHTARWRRLRKHRLEHPLCVYCLAHGRDTPATVVDHVTPHRGEWTAFCIGKLQSVCEPCHKSTKAQIEQRAHCCDAGLDGLPIDQNHPFLCVLIWLAPENNRGHDHAQAATRCPGCRQAPTAGDPTRL